MTAILEIWRGSDSVSLLAPGGYILDSSYPAGTPNYKNGGVWRGSSLSDGMVLLDRRYENQIDTFNLKMVEGSHDLAIELEQKLFRLLEWAPDYWGQKKNNSPVYIKFKSSTATYPVYAIICEGRIPTSSTRMAQPFTLCQPVMENLSLVVNHTPWMGSVPGSSECVEVSGLQAEGGAVVKATYEPGASADDGWMYYLHNVPAISLVQEPVDVGLSYISIGATGYPFERFRSVTIPQGATILSAYITFTSSSNSGGSGTDEELWNIQVEDSANSAVFSTLADYTAREWREDSVAWLVPQWALDTTYNSPDIAPLIQAIVDKTAWASGNAISFKFSIPEGSTQNGDQQYYTYDNGSLWPTLTVSYVTPDAVGRTETCDLEVYLANKHNVAQITHVFYYDASATTWSNNLVGSYPNQLLPTNPGNGDYLVIGIEDTGVGGPFSNAVFDLATAAVYGTGCAGSWDYWVAAWTDLDVADHTARNDSYPLSRTGNWSVHWEQPNDWAQFNPSDDVGGTNAEDVELWAVRMIVSVASNTTISTPYQDANRQIYTTNWAKNNADEDAVYGGMSALARLKLYNMCGIPLVGASDISISIRRMHLSTRSRDRGANFTPYINLSGTQNPAGITATPIGAITSVAVASDAPTGRVLFYNPGAGGVAQEAIAHVGFSPDMSEEYKGKYRVYLRGKQVGGDVTTNYITLQLKQLFGGSPVSKSSDEKVFDVVNVVQLLDMGVFELSFDKTGYKPLATAYGNVFVIYAETAAGTPDLELYELILMPVDEWTGTYTDPSLLAAESGPPSRRVSGSIYGLSCLDLDSVSSIKDELLATVNTGLVFTDADLTFGPELLTNGNMEAYVGTQDDGNTDTITGWTNSGTGAGDLVEATATVNTGSSAVKLVRGNDGCLILRNVAVVPGGVYRFLFYARGDGATSLRYSLYDNTNAADITGVITTGATAAAYVLRTVYVTIPAGCVSVRIYFYTNAAGTVYVDDASFMLVTGTTTVDDQDNVLLGWDIKSNSPIARLLHYTDEDLWMLNEQYIPANSCWTSNPNSVFSLRAWANRRYIIDRGSK